MVQQVVVYSYYLTFTLTLCAENDFKSILLLREKSATKKWVVVAGICTISRSRWLSAPLSLHNTTSGHSALESYRNYNENWNSHQRIHFKLIITILSELFNFTAEKYLELKLCAPQYNADAKAKDTCVPKNKRQSIQWIHPQKIIIYILYLYLLLYSTRTALYNNLSTTKISK